MKNNSTIDEIIPKCSTFAEFSIISSTIDDFYTLFSTVTEKSTFDEIMLFFSTVAVKSTFAVFFILNSTVTVLFYLFSTIDDFINGFSFFDDLKCFLYFKAYYIIDKIKTDKKVRVGGGM